MPLSKIVQNSIDSSEVLALSGIKFPATQSASSDANTLDDYEEGTWTPVVTAQTGSITSYTSSGMYIKIGQMVMIYGYIKITNAGTATDNMFIAGFPFTTATTGGGNGVNVLVAKENDVVGNMGNVRIDSGGTTGLLRRYDNGLSSTIMTTNYAWNFNGCYRASA